MENRKSERGFIRLKKPIWVSKDIMQIDFENKRLYITENEEEGITETSEYITTVQHSWADKRIMMDIYVTEEKHIILCIYTKKGDNPKEHRQVKIPLLPLGD